MYMHTGVLCQAPEALWLGHFLGKPGAPRAGALFAKSLRPAGVQLQLHDDRQAAPGECVRWIRAAGRLLWGAYRHIRFIVDLSSTSLSQALM